MAEESSFQGLNLKNSLEHFYFKYLHIQRRRNNLRTRF